MFGYWKWITSLLLVLSSSWYSTVSVLWIMQTSKLMIVNRLDWFGLIHIPSSSEYRGMSFSLIHDWISEIIKGLCNFVVFEKIFALINTKSLLPILIHISIISIFNTLIFDCVSLVQLRWFQCHCQFDALYPAYCPYFGLWRMSRRLHWVAM